MRRDASGRPKAEATSGKAAWAGHSKDFIETGIRAKKASGTQVDNWEKKSRTLSFQDDAKGLILLKFRSLYLACSDTHNEPNFAFKQIKWG